MRRVVVPSAYVVLVGAAVALLGVNVFAWSGGLAEDPAPAPAPNPEQQPPAKPAPLPAPEPEAITRPRTTRPKGPVGASLTISATRGDCWVEVRAESSSGDVLYAGTLATGKTLRFNREKLWLRLGAAANVDITVNGRPSTVPPGTVELVLPA
jgi:hypothetical protein